MPNIPAGVKMDSLISQAVSERKSRNENLFKEIFDVLLNQNEFLKSKIVPERLFRSGAK